MVDRPKVVEVPESAIQVSLHLQKLADMINKALFMITGKKIHFSLIVWTDGITSYVSNAERQSVRQAIQELTDRWDSNEPDTPVHQGEQGNG